MPTIEEWTLAIISNVVHFAIIIAILYTLRRFYKHRYSQALQKRSPLLVYLMNICFIFYLLNHIAYKIAYIHGLKDPNIDPILTGEDIRHPHIISLISVICYIFSLHGMTIMWIARSWIIYFNTKYGLELQKNEWGVHLNDHYSDTLWFVKHRKDYGSKRVIYPIAITWYFIHALFQTVFLIEYPDIQKIYDSASWLFELIILVIIWNRIPDFKNDIFGIKREMQWMFRVAGIALMLYIGWTVKLLIVGYDLWTFMIAQFIFGILVGIMALILNGFVFQNSDYNHLVMSIFNTTRLRTISVSTSTSTFTREELSLSQVLGNEQLIQCLFQHLTDEFSVELLLALIEFKQFHDLMMNDEEFMSVIQSGNNRISDNILATISLAHELPKSNIVHENHCNEEENGNHIRRYLRIARDLYDKYVSTKAEFEVNLGYECRQEITYFIQQYSDLSGADTFGENEQFELFVLFNEASNELYRLLRTSHDRYITANKYYPMPISSAKSV